MGTSAEANLDPHLESLRITGGLGALMCYSLLVKFKSGPELKPPSYVITGDLAESWTQPDDLTYIFKLRQGVKFHNLPPVSGRELVADDVVYSLQRVRELKVFSGNVAG